MIIVETPRSDIEKTTQEQETKQKRPSTAPSKRLLSSSTPSGGRPRSARNDSTSHSINILTDESENKENLNNTLVEKLIFLQNGLFITGNPVCRVHSSAYLVRLYITGNPVCHVHYHAYLVRLICVSLN